MASPNQSRPGRSLLVITLLTIALYGWIFWPFADHSTTPKLGLDLRGGTSVTLVPKTTAGQGKVTSSQIDQAVDIIRNRVNGFGVSEADVTTQGSGAGRTIVVSVPGENQKRIVDLVGETAQLNFRKVLAEAAGGPTTTTTSTASPTASSTSKATSSASPKASASGSTQATITTAPTASATTGKNSALSSALVGADAPKAAATPAATPTATATSSPSASPKATGSAAAAAKTKALTPPIQSDNQAVLTKAFADLDCTDPANRQGGVPDDPAKPLVTCSTDGATKYALDATAVSGKDISGASATIQSSGVGQWIVNLDFNSKGSKQFATVTGELNANQSPQNQFAIVLDGLVVSPPQVTNGAITGGSAQISGNFTQTTAQDLANVLKYGALPLTFEKAQVDTVSPTLGSDQLNAGLLAGAIELFLVMLYLLMYYRALGSVAILSLVYAGLITYALVVILGNTIGFTLTLAGVTGLIVSIGITADSFIVYFERMRDEIRDGRSLRVGVETGWARARRTIVAADFVSILAAAVLYFISVGSVRGFAFTLGLTTLVDLVVVFLFTKPVMTLLARTKFFGQGSRMSGLDPERLGVHRPPAPVAAGQRSAAVKEA